MVGITKGYVLSERACKLQTQKLPRGYCPSGGRFMVRSFAISFILLLTAVTAGAMPFEGCGTRCSQCHSLSKEEASRLLQGIGEVKSVRMAPIKGLFELTVENKGREAVVYVNYGKTALIPSPIFNIATRRPFLPASSARHEQQKPPRERVDINTVPTANSIVIGNPSGKKKLFVFTDPECPFCAHLHKELWKLVALEPDLTIYVKMFPLKMHPGSFDRARVILSAGTPEILNKNFAGEPLPAPGLNDPAKPVEDTIKYGESIGISATPTIILPDGRIVVGYRDAQTLKKLIAGEKTVSGAARRHE